jgi:flagellar hook assembly protein FlgD
LPDILIIQEDLNTTAPFAVLPPRKGAERENMKIKAAVIAAFAVVVLLSGMAAAGPIADITTDKKAYQQGEDVTITVTNNCRGPMAFNGYWVDGVDGKNVYMPPMELYPVIIAPGGTHSEVWNQNGNDGAQVAPGAYTVEFEYGSAGITIEQATVEVATDKGVYRSGEEVIITLTNNGKEAVPLNGYWVENADGKFVYAPPMPLFPQFLQPGESHEYAWAQVDESGEKVESGDYEIRIAQDSTGIRVAAPDVVTVSTDRSEYQVGDLVTVTVTNAGELPVILAGFWVEDSKGETIYAPPMLDYVRYLQPGESFAYEWAQVDDGGEQVAPGTYSVHIQQGGVGLSIIGPQLYGDSVVEDFPDPPATRASMMMLRPWLV